MKSTSFIAQSLVLPTPEATDTCGANLAKLLVPGLFITLEGDLGAGKTAFVRAVLRTCGVKGAIKSPTYALVESYDLANDVAVHHMDFYRLQTPHAWREAGLQEYFDGHSIIFIEWPSKAAGLPTADLALHLSVDPINSNRCLKIIASTDMGKQILAQWVK